MKRVQKILSNCGFCSRRKAEELIKAGRVKVNDRVVYLGDKAVETDEIYVNGKIVSKQGKLYLMFNKPIGCVTAVNDKRFKTVMDYIKIKTRVFPVGRLDYSTSGLLLLTNDGDFANQIMHPRYEMDKTYLVELDKPIDKDKIDIIESGINLEDGKTAPAKIKLIQNNSLKITIHEGKNRIVRRIFKKMGFSVRKLHRLAIGKLTLGDLKIKKYKVLSELDKKKIFSS
ncbi:MAG: pseudouridine synthase [Candidatus Gygaella obscura]|nr:pseudouridine synthase [Candidatus Gygaella obscura]